MWKKFGTMLCASAMVLTLAGCGGSEQPEEDSTFVVGMECAYAPYNWTQTDDSNGAVPISNVPGAYANGYDVMIAKKIAEYEEAGLDFEAIIEKVDDFILHMHTYFVLESLDNLRKNGRLSAVKALVATALNIKPVMGATDQGVIIQLGQARGMQKALRLMAETITAELEHPEEKVLGLVHCNNPERAEYVKQELMKLVKVKDIIVLESSGVSTLYAAQGGIIIAV